MTQSATNLAGEKTNNEDPACKATEDGGSRFRRLSESLSKEQQRALELLAEGNSIPAVANAVGVHRATIYRWITAEPYFRAAYNSWQLEQRESFRAVLLKCGEKAVQRVATMVDYDHQFAWKIAKELGMVAVPSALSTDPQQVAREIELERLEEEERLARRQPKGSPPEPAKTTAAAIVEETAPVILEPVEPVEVDPEDRGPSPEQLAKQAETEEANRRMRARIG